MSAINGNRKIGVLVDAMGRVNYGEHMTDRKRYNRYFHRQSKANGI